MPDYFVLDGCDFGGCELSAFARRRSMTATAQRNSFIVLALPSLVFIGVPHPKDRQ